MSYPHLAEPMLAISEVAYLVGYSEPAPFNRAPKRWPEVYRRNEPAGHR